MAAKTIRGFVVCLASYIIIMALGAHGFVATSNPTTRVGVCNTSSRTRRHTSLLRSSRQQAMNFLSSNYPKFYYLLQQNPDALREMQDTITGFAVFAPSDDTIDAYYGEQVQMLDAACNVPELHQVVTRMAAYHMVNSPTTTDIMGKFNVVNSRVGELPVEVDAQDGTMYVNQVPIIQSYKFEDKIVQNYQDSNGNLLGSEDVGGGKTCIIHEVGGFVCPDELWQLIYEHFQSPTGAGIM